MAAVVVALVYHFFLVLASRLGTVDLVSDVLSALYFAQGHTFLALQCHCVHLLLTADMLYYRRSMDISIRTMKMSVTSVSVSLLQQPSLL